MKRSLTVKLVFLGTVASAVTACGREEKIQVHQQTYASREACEADWGRDNDDCKPDTTSPSSGGSHGGGSAYVGPRYYWDRGLGHPMVVEPSGATRPAPGSHVTANGSSLARAVSTASASRSSSGSVVRGGFGTSAHAMSAGG